MASIFFEEKVGVDAKVVDPDSVLFFRDHLTFLGKVMSQERIEQGLLDVANQLEVKQRHVQPESRTSSSTASRWGSASVHRPSATPRSSRSTPSPACSSSGTDSHTPHAGAIGAVAFGVGTTAIFNSWITKDVRVKVPQSFKVVVTGEPAPNVTAKDYMLEILRHPYIRDGEAIGQIIEYAGPAVEALSVDERATMANMAAEVGAFTGIIAADEKSVEFMVNERGMDRARAEDAHRGHAVRSGRRVREGHRDRRVTAIRPMAALPNDPGNGVFIDELGDAPIRIDIAYAGSCTAGKKEDMDMYARVLAEADAQGLRVHADVRCLHPVRLHRGAGVLPEQGYMDALRAHGCRVHRARLRRLHCNAGPGVTQLRRMRSPSRQPEPELPGAVRPGESVSRLRRTRSRLQCGVRVRHAVGRLGSSFEPVEREEAGHGVAGLAVVKKALRKTMDKIRTARYLRCSSLKLSW